MMRSLVFDVPDDVAVLKQDCEYMFGPEYLVCPVLEESVREWKVYLPQRDGLWEDTRNGNRYNGGQYVTAAVDLEAIPVFRALS